MVHGFQYSKDFSLTFSLLSIELCTQQLLTVLKCVCILWSPWTTRRTLKYLKIISTQWDVSLFLLQVHTHTFTESPLLFSRAQIVWTVCGLWRNWGDSIIIRAPENRAQNISFSVWMCASASVCVPFSLSRPRRGESFKYSHASHTQEMGTF